MRTVWISLASMTMGRRAVLDLDFARRTCISLARPFHLSTEQFDPNYLLRASTVPHRLALAQRVFFLAITMVRLQLQQMNQYVACLFSASC